MSLTAEGRLDGPPGGIEPPYHERMDELLLTSLELAPFM
jgi:hypothetical protein